MELVVLSAPEDVNDEIDIIKGFFEFGLQRFHLRKPFFSASQTEYIIKQLPEHHYSKIVLHEHHHLADKYKLGGIHFTQKHFKWNASGMRSFSTMIKPKEGKTISASFHSLSEVSENAGNYNYLFLSPVFDSISKKNYPGSFELTKLKEFFQQYKMSCSTVERAKVIGLGGVKIENISIALDVGFDGVALFGTLWMQKKSEDIMNTFQQFMQNCIKNVGKGN